MTEGQTRADILMKSYKMRWLIVSYIHYNFLYRPELFFTVMLRWEIVTRIPSSLLDNIIHNEAPALGGCSTLVWTQPCHAQIEVVRTFFMAFLHCLQSRHESFLTSRSCTISRFCKLYKKPAIKDTAPCFDGSNANKWSKDESSGKHWEENMRIWGNNDRPLYCMALCNQASKSTFWVSFSLLWGKSVQFPEPFIQLCSPLKSWVLLWLGRLAIPVSLDGFHPLLPQMLYIVESLKYKKNSSRFEHKC